MNYVFELMGGIGKHLMFTSFIRWLNEKHPESKITIISSYPDIFEYNPRIHRNLRLDQPYLFEDYIKGNDYRAGEPYKLLGYYREKNKKHFCELLPKAYGFNDYNKEFQSEIYLTKGEEMDGKMFCEQNKKLITFQGCGGLPPGAQANRMKIDMSQRDIPMPLAQFIVDTLVKKGFRVLQLRGPSEAPLNNTIQLNLPFRNLLPIIKNSVGHVGIDSCGMHAAAVWKKPQLIFWGQTHVDNVGYKYENVVNVFNEFGMHCRPNIQLPDREGIYPYKDKNEGLEFKYDEKVLSSKIDLFLESL